MATQIRLLVFIVCLFFIIDYSYGTGQIADKLIIQNETFYLYTNPLEPYLNFKNSRLFGGVELTMTNTACWRGYIATWEIQNDSLFLVKIVRETQPGKGNELNLRDEFGCDRVFASWYTGTLRIPMGGLLNYVHMGYASIHEKEAFYRVYNGSIKSTELKNYLVYNKDLLYPAEKFLADTLTQIIKSKLDEELMKQVPDSVACFLYVTFNKEGKVEKISSDEKTLFGRSICKIAEEEFTKLPPLMPVTHEYYSPPYLEIFFNAYCIKNPWDKKYGCH